MQNQVTSNVIHVDFTPRKETPSPDELRISRLLRTIYLLTALVVFLAFALAFTVEV